MIVLRRLIIAAILVLVVQAAKWMLDSYSPESRFFHQEFLWALQVLVAAWFVLTSILSVFKKGNSWFARFLPVIMVLVIIVVDIWFSHLLTHPAKISNSMLPAFRRYYEQFEKKDLRYEPCTTHDSLTGHRFVRDVGFAFGNIEYRNEYRVNSESLRDSEGDLFGPEIICAGNTFTFGCGVEADQTFTSLFAADTEKKVLNMGVANRGTVNQLRWLNNVDTSVLEYLVVQYSLRDAEYNSQYLQGDSSVLSQETFDMLRKQYNWRREYFPGKYAMIVLTDIVQSWFTNKNTVVSDAEQTLYAEQLVQVLSKLIPNTRYKVMLVHVDERGSMDTGIMKKVDGVLRSTRYSAVLPQVTVLNTSGVLQDADYYKLDTYLKPSGHEKISRVLWDAFVELEK